MIKNAKGYERRENYSRSNYAHTHEMDKQSLTLSEKGLIIPRPLDIIFFIRALCFSKF